MAVNSAGQFYHGVEFEVGDLRPGEVPEKPDATMYVKGHQLNVTRYVLAYMCFREQWTSTSDINMYLTFGEKKNL